MVSAPKSVTPSLTSADTRGAKATFADMLSQVDWDSAGDAGDLTGDGTYTPFSIVASAGENAQAMVAGSVGSYRGSPSDSHDTSEETSGAASVTAAYSQF